MSNATCQTHPLPQFSNLDISHAIKHLQQLIDDNRQTLQQILATSYPQPEDNKLHETISAKQHNPHLNWDTLMQPLDDMSEHISHYWSLVNHLHSVKDSEALRQVIEQAQPLLTDYYTELSHHQRLFRAMQALQNSPSQNQLTTAQHKSLANDLRDFKLAGVALNDEDKKQFKKISLTLSQLTTRFAQNVLDATDSWFYHATDPQQVSGIPEHALQHAQHCAKEKELSGWIFTLQGPSFSAVMTYADDRMLRRTIYEAYMTRASDKGPDAGRWDNGPIIEKILAARLELAKLLGYTSFAAYSLATKMANSCEQVTDFLQQLADASFDSAKKQFKNLESFAKQHQGPEKLQAWDVAYYSEKLRQQQYAFSDEDLRPYFALPRVLSGLFEIVKRLYGIHIVEIKQFDSWHPDVRCYAIYDKEPSEIGNDTQKARAYFYLDPYARKQKRGGAWMDDCRTRRTLTDGTLEIPVAFLVCNFTPPTEQKPALLTHDEVVTLFHEFGHGLHHMLSKVNTLGVSGINGVAWDAVELPSQFMENWAYDRESLDLFAQHHQTGDLIPDSLFNKMQKARNFHAAMKMMRQLEFSLFDFILHQQDESIDLQGMHNILDQVQQTTRVTPRYQDDRFAYGFSHIFAGGYAAGYYSYKWAEVMAADAFAVFKQHGIYNTTYSKKFLHCILEKGGSEDAGVLFKDFRGHDPDINALLKQDGIL